MVSQISNRNKNRLDRESFYQSNIERLLHLKAQDCKSELLRLNLTKNKISNRKIVNFQVFTDSAHQADLERYQEHIKLDKKCPYNVAHGRITYDLHDKHWISHIGILILQTAKPIQKKDTKKKCFLIVKYYLKEYNSHEI